MQLETKMGVVEKANKNTEEDLKKGEEEMEEEEEQCVDGEYENMLLDQETFIKALETFGSKSTDTPIFGGKMDLDSIMDLMKEIW